jgi:catechol 2,3-dioxygenase-like lactoylglutathione lyase family enzyme
MASGGLYLDHVLVGVRDLAAASRTFGDGLGFSLTPEGVHPGRGTHNRLAVFATEYLELIAVRDPDEGIFRPSLSAFLKSREGLYMFALGTANIDGAVSELRRRGVAVDDPVAGAREASGGAPGYTWRSAAVDPATTPGSETFLIQHDRTLLERYTVPASPTAHANGALGVHHIALAVHDADTAGASWREGLGLALEATEETGGGQTRRSRLRLANCYLDLVAPAGPGALSEFLGVHGEAPYELGLEVADITQTADSLGQTGVTTTGGASEDGPAELLVGPERAVGARLAFRKRSGP